MSRLEKLHAGFMDKSFRRWLCLKGFGLRLLFSNCDLVCKLALADCLCMTRFFREPSLFGQTRGFCKSHLFGAVRFLFCAKPLRFLSRALLFFRVHALSFNTLALILLGLTPCFRKP